MKSFLRKNNNILISSFLGLLIFQLKFGFSKLIPSNINWLLTVKHDWGQHYLGWSFYRNEPWHFPLGKIENYYYPISTNIGFTDSIPLFAIPFKLFSKLLSEDFQYFGIWFLLCFILTAYFSIKIFKKYNFNWLQVILITILITANPVLLFRSLHPALCAQWLILGCIYLYVKDLNTEKVRKLVFKQILLLILSALIHPYLVLIVLGFTLVFFYKITLINKVIGLKQFIYYLLISIFSIVLTWYLIGYISFSNTVNNAVDNAFGLYSMNFNAFYNSLGYSSILPNYKLVTQHQYEGFMYFGVGVIGLILVTFILSILKISKNKILVILKQNYPLLLFCLFCLIFSLTNKITFNEKVLFEINLPEILLKLGNIFRASSRIFWVNYYLIIILFFILFSKLKIASNLKSILLVCVICVQFYDLQIFFRKKEEKIGTYTSSLNLERWKTVLSNAKHLKTFPPYGFINFSTPYEYQDLAFLASKNKISYTDAYVARLNAKAELDFTNKTITDLIEKPINKDEVYVTSKEYLSNFTFQISKYNTNIGYLDGYYILYSAHKEKIVQTDEEINILNKSNSILKSRSFSEFNQELKNTENIKNHIENIFFTSNYIKINGWAFIENTKDNSKDSLFLVLYNSTKKYISSLNTIARKDVSTAFKNDGLDNSGIKSINFFNNIDKGTYNAAIAILDKNKVWQFATLKEKINIGASADLLPLKINDSLIAKNNISFNIENIQQENEFISIEGWAFVKEQTTENSKIFIILANENQKYKVETNVKNRPDVYDYFKQEYDYRFSGFSSKFKTIYLPKGNYKIGIYIKNEILKDSAFIFTNKKATIN